jgi:hypothetical protein
MAALAIVSGSALASGAIAAEKLVVPKVQLDLAIAGLGEKGCDVTVKAGGPGCKFKTVTKHIGSSGKSQIILENVETHSADHDCTFAITVKEAEHPDKIVHRGLRLSKPIEGRPSRTPVLSCYISSPSKVERAEREDRVRR